MSSIITNCVAPKGKGSGKSAARKMIATEYAGQDFVLMHSCASVPSVCNGLDEQHPKVRLKVDKPFLIEIK